MYAVATVSLSPNDSWYSYILQICYTTHCWILPGNTVPHRDGDWAKGKLRIHRWLWQDCSIPSALAMEELQSCTKPSIYGKAFQNETNMWLKKKIARSNNGVFKSIQNWFQQNVLKSSKTIHCTKTSNVKPLLKYSSMHTNCHPYINTTVH